MDILHMRAARFLEQDRGLVLRFVGGALGRGARAAYAFRGLSFRFPADRVWHLRLTPAPQWRPPSLIGPLRYHPRGRGRLKLTQER